MGKGDRKTKRGKVWRGTHGKRRPRKKKPVTATDVQGESQKTGSTENKSE